MSKKPIIAYLYEIDNKGNYILTHQTETNLANMARILGKRTVKNRKTEFEEIELIDGNYKRYRCLVKRKVLTPSIIKSFIMFTYHGERTVQRSPLGAELLDRTLLKDLNITVLQYKYYYSGNDFLADKYFPIESDEVTSEVKERLQKWTEEAIESANSIRKLRMEQAARRAVKWTRIGGEA